MKKESQKNIIVLDFSSQMYNKLHFMLFPY